MFIVILRELFVLLMVGSIVYLTIHAMRKALKLEKRRIKIEDAKENIEETIEEAKSIPIIEEKKLQQAQNKIENLIKTGNKYKGV